MPEWYGKFPFPGGVDILEPLLDGGWLPIPILRIGIRKQLAQRLQEMKSDSCTQAMDRKMEYVKRLKQRPIAIGKYTQDIR